MRAQRGFTLIELLISTLLFGVIGMGLVAFTTHALQSLGAESRVSLSATELRNAMGLFSSELKMSSAISPYLPGNTILNCSSSVAVTSTTVKFLVVEDDPSATTTSGMKPYYVGYKYDSTTGQLLRGEIPAPSVTACTLPSGDPTSATYAKPLAERIVQVDADSSGAVDPVFSLSGNILTITLGVEAKAPSGVTARQQIVTKVYMRVHA